MKNKLKIVLFGVISLLSIQNVYAASASLSVNKSSIENGSSVRASVTLSGVASWNVKINSSGATSGCSNAFADASSNGQNTTKTFSVTCKATSTGIINFSLSGDITSADGKNVNVSGSKMVKVTVPRPKSTNNLLSSLSVEGYEISPSFAKNTKEYSVTVPSTVDKVIVNAKAEDQYASISGIGEQVVEEGINNLEIIVTSETGVSNTYKLTVTVEDINPIEIEINKKKYTIIKNAKNLVKPVLFDESTVKIKNFDIPAFVNKVSKLTIVGIKDDKGNILYATYNNGKYELYNEVIGTQYTIMPLNIEKKLKGYIKTSIEINDIKVDAYKVKESSRFAVIYGLNVATGKKDFYTYDTLEKTLMIYDDELKNSLEEMNFYLLIASSIFGVGLLLSIIALISTNKKKNKYLKKLKSNEDDLPETKIKETKNKDNENNDIVETPSDPSKSLEDEEVYDIFEDNKKKKKK